MKLASGVGWRLVRYALSEFPQRFRSDGSSGQYGPPMRGVCGSIGYGVGVTGGEFSSGSSTEGGV